MKMKMTVECFCGTIASWEGEQKHVMKEYKRFIDNHLEHIKLSEEDKQLLREQYAAPGAISSVKKFLSNKILKECFYISPKEPDNE